MVKLILIRRYNRTMTAIGLSKIVIQILFINYNTILWYIYCDIFQCQFVKQNVLSWELC